MMEQCVDHLSSMKKSRQLNQQMQFILEQEIAKMESLLALNKEKQATLVNIMQAEERLQKTSRIRDRGARVFAAPYFHDAKEMAAPPNEDEIIKRKNREANAFFLRPPRPWTAEEYKKLNLGLVSYAISTALKPLRRERDRIKNKMQDTIISAKEREDLEDDLYIVEQKIRLVKRKPLPEVMEQLKELDVDWMIVSATHMEGIRSPEECEIMWKNYLRFDVNKEPFSVEEGNKLWHLARKHNERNWDDVATSLKTNRTAIQCYQRYQTTVGADVRKKYWTKEEDDLLLELVEKHRNGVIPWGKISLLMEGRTRTQIRDRYYRGIQICYPGAFTPEEDAVVLALHQKHGRKWSTIKLYLKRRSVEQVRERFRNALKPNKKYGPWTEDEDRLLINMVKRHGYGHWAKISRDIPGRGEHQCLLRAGRLLNWSIEYHSERGKEYDPGVHDPELFASLLRVRPKFKYQEYHRISYSRIKPHREIALKRLLQALKVVAPEYAAGIKDVNDIDVSWMSIELMHKLSDELHADIPDLEDEVEIFKRPPVIRKRHELMRKTVESESDDEHYVQPPQEVIPREENNLVKSALYAMLEMQGNVKCPYKVQKIQEIGLVQWAEMSLYAEYLYKQFHCKTLCDKDEEDEKIVFREVDYEKSLQNIISWCIQPPVYDNQFIVLAPNTTTLTGMETVEATEDRLLSMSECASHSKPYIDYLCERRKSPPQCLRCLHRSGEIASSATPQAVMSDMKKKSFLLTKRLEDSAYMEGASVERVSHSCVCKDLEDSKDSVQLLRKRFMSLFMWPSLLSAVGFSEEQDNLLISEKFKDPGIGHEGAQDPDCCDVTSPMEFQRSEECRQKRKRKASAGKRATKKLKLDEPIDDDVVCLN